LRYVCDWLHWIYENEMGRPSESYLAIEHAIRQTRNVGGPSVYQSDSYVQAK